MKWYQRFCLPLSLWRQLLLMWPASKSTKLNCVYDILLEYEDADAVYAFVDFECIFARMRMRAASFCKRKIKHVRSVVKKIRVLKIIILIFDNFLIRPEYCLLWLSYYRSIRYQCACTMGHKPFRNN